MNGRQPHEISLLQKNERNEIIKQLRKREGFSIRQIETTTGISRGVIAKIGKNDIEGTSPFRPRPMVMFLTDESVAKKTFSLPFTISKSG